MRADERLFGLQAGGVQRLGDGWVRLVRGGGLRVGG